MNGYVHQPTSAEQTTAWPEGVIARYLTVGGATVDIAERSGQDAATATATAATCTGCGDSEVIDWTRQAWSNYANRFIEEPDEGGRIAAPKVRKWAQAHAEKCRALPRPDGSAS